MESLTKIMNWVLFRLGDVSITVGQVVVVSITIVLVLALAGVWCFPPWPLVR